MKIKELVERIQEDLEDGTLRMEDEIFIGDDGEKFHVIGLFSDSHELLIQAY